jgi:hypothetical protein
MSLTGHLDVFPLEEVLRLLSRSQKSGCLRVESPEVHGRVYLDNGSLSFATVSTDDELRRQLTVSGLVDDDALRTAEVGGRPLTEVLPPSVGHHALTEVVREEIVESLYRIRRPGRGQFVFNVDVAPHYRFGQAFDVELCVTEADRRSAEWADIESVIENIDLPLRINGEAPGGEPVTLAPSSWRLVAGFEGSATVRSLADRLGISRFRVAKDLAAMVRAGLVEPVAAEQPQPAPEPVAELTSEALEPQLASFPNYWETPAEPTVETPAEVEPPAEVEAPAAEAESEPLAPAPVAAEPVTSEPVSPFAEEEAPAPAAVTASVDPNRSWWQEPEQDKKQDEEQGLSESFLDEVFSQLKEDEQPEAEKQPEEPPTSSFGHGFLKRRRMSSIGLDEN